MEPIIVAFCGAKRHGKDTAAKILIKDYGFTRVSFADGLRETVAKALRVNVSYFLDDEKKEEIDPRTGQPRRYWLQHVGTEGFRSLWPDIWLWWWQEEIKARGYERVVCTDMRFPNEFDIVKSYKNSLTFRVTDPRKPVNNDGHASEAHYASLPVDMDIANSGTIVDLQTKVENAVRHRFGLSPVDYLGIE